ncbi:unnamed protein product [Timema podura]|uniref:C2H2-type domain-containing protein n=1 Tax=Timema podura TaxID=61482 RepID=A0ABN7NV89_TIMPD|nr:unnamed protein product [Timema podura]
MDNSTHFQLDPELTKDSGEEEVFQHNDPRVIEQKELQQPSCLPLSYILRFFTDAARKEWSETKRKLSQSHASKQLLPSVTTQSNTPTGSEADEDEAMSESEDSNDSWTTPEEFSAEFILRYGSSEADEDEAMSESEDSNDSWTTPEEFSAEFILRYGSRMLNSSTANNGAGSSNNNNNNNVDKPFACPVPGCKKRYKNVNGIKYHSKNGHKKDGKVRKGYKCHCGKSYKTGQGLKSHTAVHHSGVNLTTLTNHSGEVLQIPTSHVQPLCAISLKQVQSSALGVLTPAASPQIPTSLPGDAPPSPHYHQHHMLTLSPVPAAPTTVHGPGSPTLGETCPVPRSNNPIQPVA